MEPGIQRLLLRALFEGGLARAGVLLAALRADMDIVNVVASHPHVRPEWFFVSAYALCNCAGAPYVCLLTHKFCVPFPPAVL